MAPQPTSVLDHAGKLVPGAESPLSEDLLREAFRLMLMTRVFDERAFSLQRQGRLGTFSPGRGQEASVVGSALALDPARDWVVPQYREMAALLHHGYPLLNYLLYQKGDAAGARIPDGVKMLPMQIALAAQLPHAVGLAWGLRHQGDDGVVCVYFGDGASSEGDTHEAMNLAGVRNAPVVFFLQNNGWAISTPVHKQTRAESFAARAAGYGINSARVNGNDLFAVYAATHAAVERARAGGGPTLIESVTYRLGPHNTADDPTRYRSADEVAQHESDEPIERVRAYMRAASLLTDEEERSMVEQLTAEVNAAVAAMELAPTPGIEQVFSEAYAVCPGRVQDQWRAATGSEVA